MHHEEISAINRCGIFFEKNREGFSGQNRPGRSKKSLRIAECNNVDVDWFGTILSESQERRVLS